MQLLEPFLTFSEECDFKAASVKFRKLKWSRHIQGRISKALVSSSHRFTRRFALFMKPAAFTGGQGAHICISSSYIKDIILKCHRTAPAQCVAYEGSSTAVKPQPKQRAFLLRPKAASSPPPGHGLNKAEELEGPTHLLVVLQHALIGRHRGRLQRRQREQHGRAQ